MFEVTFDRRVIFRSAHLDLCRVFARRQGRDAQRWIRIRVSRYIAD